MILNHSIQRLYEKEILYVFTVAYIKCLWIETQETHNSDYLYKAESRVAGVRVEGVLLSPFIPLDS